MAENPDNVALPAASQTSCLPEINAGLCVHSISPLATCRDCVDRCPAGALVMDDEALGIDVEACTGCGVCQPACPQNAISISGEVPRYRHTALLVCSAAETADPGLSVTCLHAQGLEQIARLYELGVRKLATASSACDTCLHRPSDKGGKAHRLVGYVETFNRLSSSRNLPKMEIVDADPTEFSVWRERKKNDLSERHDTGRRAFLRSILRAGDDVAPDTGASRQAALARFLAPRGASVSPKTKGRAIYAAVPRIDGTRCDGCELCMKICPNEALMLVKDGATPKAYTTLPHLCTDCGLCVDVCESQAIGISHLEEGNDVGIALKARCCSSCKAGFHFPVVHPTEGSLCRICRVTDHRKNLFQVLD